MTKVRHRYAPRKSHSRSPPASMTVRFSSLVVDTITHLAALNRSAHTVLSYDMAYSEFATYSSTLQPTDHAQHSIAARIVGVMAWLLHHMADNTWASTEHWAIPRLGRVIPALIGDDVEAFRPDWPS